MNNTELLNTVNLSEANAEALDMTNTNLELFDEQLDNINGGAGFTAAELAQIGQVPKGLIPKGGTKSINTTVIYSSSTGNRR